MADVTRLCKVSHIDLSIFIFLLLAFNACNYLDYLHCTSQYVRPRRTKAFKAVSVTEASNITSPAEVSSEPTITGASDVPTFTEESNVTSMRSSSSSSSSPSSSYAWKLSLSFTDPKCPLWIYTLNAIVINSVITFIIMLRLYARKAWGERFRRKGKRAAAKLTLRDIVIDLGNTTARAHDSRRESCQVHVTISRLRDIQNK